MALGSALLFARPSTLGLAPLACFAAANIVGTALWRSRGRLAPYPAFQIQLTVVGVCAWVVLSFLTEDIEGAGRFYRGLLLIPGAMIALHFLERAARRNRAVAE
jgi:hypothetical protein